MTSWRASSGLDIKKFDIKTSQISKVRKSPSLNNFVLISANVPTQSKNAHKLACTTKTICAGNQHKQDLFLKRPGQMHNNLGLCDVKKVLF